jgi:NO-binding membrane sensor protein with MHYT domain
VVSVHNFTFGVLNPGLGYAMSSLGAFLGLRCVALSRYYTGLGRLRWLVMAALSMGATGMWTMHFIAMLGFTVQGQTIYYDVPLTIGSMLVSVAAVGVGLFITGFSRAGFASAGDFPADWRRLLAGGAVIGIGVTVMHYMGMAAMSMKDQVSYSAPLVVLSVLVAVGAGTLALWIATWVRRLAATLGAALVMGLAVTAMHYTGMAALQVGGGTGTMSSMPSMGAMSASGITAVSGTAAASFVIPLLLAISLVTFALTLTITLSPNEREIIADAEMARQLDRLERRRP